MLKRFVPIAALIILTVLIGCELKPGEYPIPNPFTTIIFTDDKGVQLLDDFFYFEPRIRDAKITARAALLDGNPVNVNFNWEMLNGEEYVALFGNSGNSVSLRAAEPGTAVIRVTAEYSGVTISRNLIVLVGADGEADWSFRIIENSSTGLNEVIEGSDIFVVFNDDKIIMLEEAGTRETLIYTMTSADPLVKITQILPNMFTISGSERTTATVFVRARTETHFVTKVISVRLMATYPMPPLIWDSATDPILVPLTVGAAGAIHQIKGTDYTLRAHNSTVPVTGDGAIRLSTINQRLIIGGGFSRVSPNPGLDMCSTSFHPPGQFDLNPDNNYRLTIHFKDVVDNSNGSIPNFRIQINNNSSSNGLSVLSGNNASFTELFNNINSPTSPGRIVINFNPRTKYAEFYNGTMYSDDPARRATALESLETAYFCIVSWGNLTFTVTRIEFVELYN